jgi:hypothetical protein
MCHSLEASIVAGGLTLALTAVLWWRNWSNDRRVGFFAPTVALMQLSEALVWISRRSSGPSNGQCLNAFGGRVGLLAFCLQAITLASGGLLYDSKRQWALRWTGWYQAALTVLSVAAAIRFLPVVVRAPPQQLLSHPGQHGHLEWGFLHLFRQDRLLDWVYVMCFTTVWGLWHPAWHGLLFGSVAGVTFLYAKLHAPQEWGSVWCYTANMLGLLQLVLPLLRSRRLCRRHHRPRGTTVGQPQA